MKPDYGTILFCTQLGPKATTIFQHAVAIAERFQAKIVVLHVREVLRPDQEGMVEGYTGKGSIHSIVEREETAARADLERRIVDSLSGEIGSRDWHDVVDRIVLIEGHAKKEIIRQIEEVDADLVVIGAHRYGLMDVLLGTTPQRVIAGSRVPVVVVPVPHED
jgi:nucleotide-binding universal stress UspA family protein